MIVVLYLDEKTDAFSPLLSNEYSKSFLPLPDVHTLLSAVYSRFNGYISREHIFINCTPSEKQHIIDDIPFLKEENLIIEPKRLNFLFSCFYSNLFLRSLFPEEIVLHVKAAFLFSPLFSLEHILYSISKACEKKYVVFPSLLLKKNSTYPDSTIIYSSRMKYKIKTHEFYSIYDFKETDMDKTFGKKSMWLEMIAALPSSFIDNFSIINHTLSLQHLFSNNAISWNELTRFYEEKSEFSCDLTIIKKNPNFITIFLDTIPFFMDNWSSFFERYNMQHNCITSGKVKYENCHNIIVFNFDTHFINLKDIDNVLIVQKDGITSIKKIFL